MSDNNCQHRIKEFAKLAGVTVRALHHYDRLGVLKPRRTAAGYRVYYDRDLERLEQVVALKFVGLSLGKIKTLLDRDPLEVREALRMQRRVLEEKRRLLDRAIDAIREAESAADPGKRLDAQLLKKIIEVIEMQNDSDWMLKYANHAAVEKVADRRHLWSPELQERVSKQWMELIADVESSLGEDPQGAKGQALAERWMTLVEGFTGGDSDIRDSVKNLYAHRSEWPEEAKRQMEPFRIRKEVWTFINAAIAGRKQRRD